MTQSNQTLNVGSAVWASFIILLGAYFGMLTHSTQKAVDELKASQAIANADHQKFQNAAEAELAALEKSYNVLAKSRQELAREVEKVSRENAGLSKEIGDLSEGIKSRPDEIRKILAAIQTNPDAARLSADVDSLKKRLDGDQAWITAAVPPETISGDHGRAEVGYRKDASGYVHLRGFLQGKNNKRLDTRPPTIVFTLPIGYRPAHLCEFPYLTSERKIAGIFIEPNGEVSVDMGAGTVYAGFDGITFLAEK